MEVHAFPTIERMADAAALDLCATIGAAIARQGYANVMVATGNSQLALYKSLARLGGAIDWGKVTCFHIDEYVGITGEHSASFVKYLRERLEAVVRPRAFHFLQGDAPDPQAECARYSALLAAHPLDICVLGIGENGHLGFNDPPPFGGADFADKETVKIVRLDEACRQQQVGEGHFPNLDAVPKTAFTTTIPGMLAAKTVIAVVPEKRKAAIVRQTLQREEVSEAVPSTILRTMAHVRLYLDGASASEIMKH